MLQSLRVHKLAIARQQVNDMVDREIEARHTMHSPLRALGHSQMRLLVQIRARGPLIAYRRLPACQPAQRDLVVPQQATLVAPRDPQRRRDVLLTVMKLDSPNSQRDRRFASPYHIVAPLKHNARLLS